jgi:hypothetical protein
VHLACRLGGFYDLLFMKEEYKLIIKMCQRDVQKLLGKINYLRQFIANLATKIDSFMPLVWLKHENEFVWGDDQRKSFERKEYLVSPPVLRAPKIGKNFMMYIVVQEHVVGVVLTQDDKGKEFSVAYY